MINVNKLFPRLSIRTKLVVAFALVALGPLAVVSVLGARETIRQIEANARSTMEHDLQMAEAQTGRSLSSAENHVAMVANVVLGPLLDAGMDSPQQRERAERVLTTLLATEPTLYQVKLVDAEGAYRMIVRATGPVRASPADAGGEYYAWRASEMNPRTRLLFAIEVAGPGVRSARSPMPAVAIVIPLHDSKGTFRGLVAGEAYASALFAQLDHASPGFAGVTGLVDEDGFFLYHSVRKRDWTTLLAARERVSLHSDFPPEIVAAILSSRPGTLVTPQREIVSHRTLSLGASSTPGLSLYRVIPLAAVLAPVRSFLWTVLVAAALVSLFVLVLAIVAAGQFTKQILLIRAAAWRLARGDPPESLDVSTNDEFEDLARDLGMVARGVASHREQREALIAERTRVLDKTHAELTDILEHSADGIIGVDPGGTIRVWNHGAERLLGFSSTEAVGRNIDSVLQPSGERAEWERSVLRREMQRDGAVVNFSTEVSAADGTPVQITLTQTMVQGSNGLPLGSSLIVRDNRLQARLEEQMLRSERLAAISVMAAGLAHEINNPLAMIGNRIECMQRDIRDRWRDTTLAADAEVLQNQVERLSSLTSSLLRFARDDTSEVGPIALGALAESTSALLQRAFATRRIRLEVALQPQIPLVLGYEKAIETVIVNLLLNAADATPPDGVVTLDIRRSAGGDAAEIEVRDTGTGIPFALRERVFDPFFTTKDVGRGTGLGLTVCRSIVDRHGGTIRVHGPQGGGCRITVTLPLQPAGVTWHAHAS